ncbi:MAG TPA: molybdopterin cofactor-binding domain-containing protein [Steroidobacteraceae bacterium]
MRKLSNAELLGTELQSLSRRGFLIAASGTGFTLAFVRSGLALADKSAPAGEHLFEPTIWYHIDRDGLVTVNITKAEMGQHVGTALARIVADELEANWDVVRLNYVDSDPKWGFMGTGGSQSVTTSFDALSRAGAAGRIALIDEGAKLLGVAAASCQARNGSVTSGRKSISYADIVRKGSLARAFGPDDLKAIVLKKPADHHLIGVDTRAIDIPSKTNGSARYGIDAEIAGMVYARPKIPPTRYGSKVLSIDDSAAKSVPGYLSTLTLDDPSGTVPGWAMVIAESFTAANHAADKVKVTWSAGETAGVSEADLLAQAKKLIDDPNAGALMVADEGVDQAFAQATTTLERTYTTSSVLHFQLEPLNALVVENNGIWEIHSGNQWQSLILPTLAKALGVDEKKIVMRTYLLGGGFGRRLNGDYTVPAALAAKALGRPVKMLCTRADDVRFDSPRSASLQRVRMAFGADKAVIAMTHDAAAGWPSQAMAPAIMSKDKQGRPYDPSSINGADHWYSVGAQRVRAILNDLAMKAFRPGWLRSVGPGWTNWALESFIDEAAHAVELDPVMFRLKLLDAKGKNAGSAPNAVGGAARQANVVRRAAERGNWRQPLPKDTGLGIATSFGQERDQPCWSACVARVRVDRSTGVVKLEKLTVVVDAGILVHPDGARAQVEGASLWGASMALHEGTQFKNGEVMDTNLNTYTPLRMADVPELDIEFIPSSEFPVGLGEPATTIVGPAIANAIFAAVGARVRDLPIRPAAVLKALQA